MSIEPAVRLMLRSPQRSRTVVSGMNAARSADRAPAAPPSFETSGPGSSTPMTVNGFWPIRITSPIGSW